MHSHQLRKMGARGHRERLLRTILFLSISFSLSVILRLSLTVRKDELSASTLLYHLDFYKEGIPIKKRKRKRPSTERMSKVSLLAAKSELLHGTNHPLLPLGVVSTETTKIGSAASDASVDGSPDRNHVKVPEQANTTIVTNAQKGNGHKSSKSNLRNHQNSTSCFLYNSIDWLHGKRIGNYVDPLMDADWVRRSLLLTSDIADNADSKSTEDIFSSTTRQVLRQSLCHSDSRFLNPPQPDLTVSRNESSNATMKMWTTRLVYLAMHYHQTRHAVQEAQHRFDHSNDCYSPFNNTEGTYKQFNDTDDANAVGLYDYECRDAKFLVVSLANIGLGANMRGGAVYAMLAGLASDRVVVFVNHARVGHKFLKRPWELVSCPRRDYQCFFMPITPCVLTDDDIAGAYSMNMRENQKLFKKGVFPAGHEDDKVWHMTVGYTPLKPPIQAAERLRSYSLRIITEQLTSSGDRAFEEMLRQAADNILTPDEPRAGYNYGAANFKINHALVMYSLRPTLSNAAKLSHILREITPTEDFSPETAFGLPVRASDKCKSESECLSFEEHLQATRAIWDKTMGPLDSIDKTVKPTVIFTSESSAMVREQQNFVANGTNFTFRIVSNTHDVTPDTGYINSSNVTSDEALLSAIASLQFQLLPRITLGNCCSNFHTLLADLLDGGCGAAQHNDFHCFQENDDPALRICCGWFKNCKEEKRLAIEQRTANQKFM